MKPTEVEILLVDDNPADLELTMHALRRSRVVNHIEVARDGREAMDFLLCRGTYAGRSGSSLPKLVLLDLKLPGTDGLDLLRELRSHRQTRFIPVIVLTSSRRRQDMVESYKLGANSFVQKVVDFERFCESIKELGFYWLAINQTVLPKAEPTEQLTQGRSSSFYPA